ncbi:MAG: PAC2 family protein [Dehalococcoidia bacterium]|nr:PAC2 family protein [Dehalococcoidia bacterium]
MSEGTSFKLIGRPKIDSSSVVVVWNQDVGKLGPRVADYLVSQLGGRDLGEISPEGFFSLSGVTVEYDVAQFPESKFYWCRNENLVIFKSDIPRFDWYGFITLVLDIAQKYFKVKHIYTVGGMVMPSVHTAPRTLLSVVNSAEMKRTLGHHEVIHGMDYETREDQRPTFSSYLLWAAKARDIPGVCLWVPVPFYLMTVEDPQACKEVLEFFDRHLELHIDFADIDNKVAEQNQKIAEARSRFPELDGYISKLESNLGLTAEEGEKLVKEMDELLRRGHRA